MMLDGYKTVIIGVTMIIAAVTLAMAGLVDGTAVLTVITTVGVGLGIRDGIAKK